MKEWLELFLPTIVIVLIALYIGNAVGLSVLCEAVPKLKRAKKYAYFTPALTTIFFVQLFFDEDLKKERGRYVWEFIKFPNKNILTLSAIAFVCEEVREKRYVAQKSNTPPKPQRIKNIQAVKSGLNEVGRIFNSYSRVAVL